MKKSTSQRMRGTLAVSVLSMVLSVCLCVGSTYAPFSDELSREHTIVIGSFGVSATLSGKLLSSTAGESESFPADSYELRVKGSGTTFGYARIFLQATQSAFPREIHCTGLLSEDIDYTYDLVLNEEAKVWVEPVWSETRQRAALRDGVSLVYGEEPPPPAEEPQKNEQTESTDGEQMGSLKNTLPADTSAGNKEDSAATQGEGNAPTTIDGKDTPAADSVEETPAIDSGADTPAADNAESTPAADSAEDTPAADSVENTPVADSGESARATDSVESAPVTDSVESAPVTSGENTPAADSGAGTPSSGDTGNTSSTDDAGGASSSGDTGGAPSSGDTDGASSSDNAGDTPASGDTGGAPSSGDTDGAPSSGDTDGAPSSGDTDGTSSSDNAGDTPVSGGTSDTGADPE